MKMCKVMFVRIGKKFCTTLYKLHSHKLSSGHRREDQLVRVSGRPGFEMRPLKRGSNQGARRNYAGCTFILVGENQVDVHLWMEFEVSPIRHEKDRSAFVLVGEIKRQ